MNNVKKIILIFIILILSNINIFYIKAKNSQDTIQYVSYTNEEINLLSKAINGEARGEPYLGQIAVGAVILNRVKSPYFPNTIEGVIYEPGAFCIVNDGQINLEPEQLCIEAAKEALNGQDPTNGALFYWNPKTATNQWMLSMPVSLEIGNHCFGLAK